MRLNSCSTTGHVNTCYKVGTSQVQTILRIQGSLTTVTFLIFLVNSLCLTGSEWNKSCSDTVVPICYNRQCTDNRQYQFHVSTQYCIHLLHACGSTHLSGTPGPASDASTGVIVQTCAHRSRGMTCCHTEVTEDTGH